MRGSATNGARPCRKADVPCKEFGPQEGMLLDLESGAYFGLEGTGLAAWRLLDGRTTLDGVRDRLVAAFGAPPKRALTDVRSFLRQLATAGLLAKAGATAPAEPAVRKAKGAPYRPPRLVARGNLKYLGQLD
jgi:hypothetical protein